jgi:hypothetical protein
MGTARLSKGFTLERFCDTFLFSINTLVAADRHSFANRVSQLNRAKANSDLGGFARGFG